MRVKLEEPNHNAMSALDTALSVLHATENSFTRITGIAEGTEVGNLEPAFVAWYVFTNTLMAWSTVKFCTPFGSPILTVVSTAIALLGLLTGLYDHLNCMFTSDLFRFDYPSAGALSHEHVGFAPLFPVVGVITTLVPYLYACIFLLYATVSQRSPVRFFQFVLAVFGFLWFGIFEEAEHVKNESMRRDPQANLLVGPEHTN